MCREPAVRRVFHCLPPAIVPEQFQRITDRKAGLPRLDQQVPVTPGRHGELDRAQRMAPAVHPSYQAGFQIRVVDVIQQPDFARLRAGDPDEVATVQKLALVVIVHVMAFRLENCQTIGSANSS